MLQPTSSRHSHPGPPADKAAVITMSTPQLQAPRGVRALHLVAELKLKPVFMKQSDRKRNIARHTHYTCSCEHAVSTCTYTHTGHTAVHTSGVPFHAVNNIAFIRSFFLPSPHCILSTLLSLSVHPCRCFFSSLLRFFLRFCLSLSRHPVRVYVQGLMFFWPCIMNWLYINHQLDALIIIYS